MPRPGNQRLMRARYAVTNGGPTKAGLAPTVGKGQHFWRLHKAKGVKCCNKKKKTTTTTETAAASD